MLLQSHDRKSKGTPAEFQQYNFTFEDSDQRCSLEVCRTVMIVSFISDQFEIFVISMIINLVTLCKITLSIIIINASLQSQAGLFL